MSQRERNAGGGAVAAPRTAEPPASGPRTAREPSPAAAPRWEDLYPSLPPSRQQELLALAQSQGLILASQLPPPPHPAPQTADRARALLAQVFAASGPDLAPAPPAESVEPIDRELDPFQADAVARALNAPDLFLIRGLPGSGKSRTIAELARQAVRRGQRVLLLAPSGAAADAALRHLGDARDVAALRVLGRDEQPDRLPPASARRTLAARERALSEQALADAREAVGRCEARLARLRALADVWGELLEVAARDRELNAALADLQARNEQVPEVVRRLAEDFASRPESDPFARNLHLSARLHAEQAAKIDEAAVECQKERGRLEEARREADARLAELRPLADAKRRWLLWSGRFWKALSAGSLAGQIAEQESRLSAVAAELAKLDARETELARARHQADDRFRSDRDRDTASEVMRRRAEIEAEAAGLRRAQATLHQRWDRAAESLAGAGVDRPAGRTAEAVRQAQAQAGRLLEQEEQALGFAREWAAFLGENGESVARRFRHGANLVAGPLSALHADAYFGDPAVRGMPFDLLILDDAQHVTETEFLQAARRATRWVLVGELPPPVDVSNDPPRDNHRTGRGNRHSLPRKRGPLADLFPRLWQRLHHAVWVREGDRLCCRLQHVPPERRGRLESEPVADLPDVELRILAPEGGEPVLAEVVFPPTMPPARAKEYLFRELNEVPAQLRTGCPTWTEEPQRLRVHFGPAPEGECTRVELESGVAELLPAVQACCAKEGPKREADLFTVGFEFDRAAGWDRPRAEEWLRGGRTGQFPDRTACLDVPQRMANPLAAWVGEVLFPGVVTCDGVTPGDEPAVEFIPVPALNDDGRRRNDGPRRDPAEGAPDARRIPASMKGGAGIEIDLGDPRQREKLPADLHPLPPVGLVNLPEAQAVVRVLESLLPGAGPLSVAVTALYPAQAELIRRLVGRSPVLNGAGDSLVIADPAALPHREFDVVLVSLTRSHGFRSVPFGDDPAQAALLLTRARRKLILLGDAGTLVRRSQWDGPLDHLDEADARREKSWVLQLVRYLQGGGSHPSAFRLREGFRT